MLITYDISCFDRELRISFPNHMEDKKNQILDVLDKAYDEWNNPEDIEDEEERAYENDACCEEHLMYRLGFQFPNWKRWASFYYGSDLAQSEEEMVWVENKKEKKWWDYINE